MTTHGWRALAIAAAIVGIAALMMDDDVCLVTARDHGVVLPQCPDGALRQTARLDLSGLRRGSSGTVTLRAFARYTVADADQARAAPAGRITSHALAIVDGAGKVTPLAVAQWSGGDGFAHARVALPELPDGDYKLRATFATRLGSGTLDAPLPLYAPARIHVITDRPLYEPGHTVQFRAVVLRARDLAPLDGRPGMWVVTDPNGEVLLEERAPAGPWGVVAGTFPLDRGAPTGAWKLAWVSSDARDEVPFTVEPFTLPRFRVEAAADRSFYRPGDAPAIRGAVLYASGAPVASAALTIRWDISGAWPPPPEWQERLLPKQAETAANGRFTLALPPIPADLQGKIQITARIAAVDPAGDRVEGAASVLASADGLEVSAVTELGDGLVEGFNNRIYLRVTTPDGRELPNAKITVRRAWQRQDPGIAAQSDEDGVASLQLDPGPPVNVVIPALPYRPAARPARVTRGEVRDLIRDSAALADQVEIDRWLAPLAACGKWVRDGEGSAAIGIRADASGRIVYASASPASLDQCVAAVVRQRRLPAGTDRMYAVTFELAEPELAELAADLEQALPAPEQLIEQIQEVAVGARDCLPALASGQLPRALTWRVRAGDKQVELGPWVDDPSGEPEAAPAVGCAVARFAGARIALATAAASDAFGVVRLTVTPPATETAARPQPTTMLGYELRVSADLPGAPSTVLRVAPGQVPDLRLRVSPVLAKPGDTVTAQLLRGPNHQGATPKQLVVRRLGADPQTVEVGDDRSARFAIAAGTRGWVEVTAGEVRALVYVAPDDQLAVSIKPKQPAYKPGDRAEIEIETRVGGTGGPAAVGLFGVDDSLAQLAPLPGASDLARLRPEVGTSSPAFGLLDGQALTLGRIRGANAAAATVLRVTSVPPPPALDATIDGSTSTQLDAVAELTDRFYPVLTELHAQVRAWERSAPAAEDMRPATLARLWNQALAAVAKRGEPVTDAYGRRLALWRLPPDLLALTDPRAVVVVGTRLPEDVENWAAWVARERP